MYGPRFKKTKHYTMTSHVRKRSVRGKPLCALWTVFLYAAARPWKSSYGMEVIMRHMFVTLPTLALSWQHAAEKRTRYSSVVDLHFTGTNSRLASTWWFGGLILRKSRRRRRGLYISIGEDIHTKHCCELEITCYPMVGSLEKDANHTWSWRV